MTGVQPTPSSHKSSGQSIDVERVWSPIVDQHATWIALNPIQGCPKACTYCFLHERGQVAVRPEVLASPEAAVEMLLASPFYEPDRPVALYTWTDVMALPSSRSHLADLLEVVLRRGLANPVVLITKCHIPDDMVEMMARARTRGVRLLAYLSYSGLGSGVERGIRRVAVRENFPRLARASVPVVHYWRPSLPASATEDRMREVLGWAARFARCTVAAGLKVEPAALGRLAGHWPELADTPGVTDAEGVYPRAFWEFLNAVPERYPGYPLFHTNACALAYVLGETDHFGIFGSQVCTQRNACPASQRERCALAAAASVRPSPAEVKEALWRRGLAGIAFTLGPAAEELVLHARVPTSAVAALTQDLRFRVRVHRDRGDAYWSSGTAGAVPLVIG
ncbi:MAG: hypothetical protein ACRDRY_12235 [Pseudonocardiaceae bacterium]